MDFKRNASDVRKGFNYQDMVALFYFLNHIENIKEIKNEGKDDIDVVFRDNTTKYFQAKETKNVNKTLSKKELKEALTTLFEDILDDKNKKITEIGIITNCNYPFTKKDANFIVPYRSEDYINLSSVAKDRITKFLGELTQYDINKFEFKKLTVIKIAYQGNDDDSKLERLEKPINRFLDKARIEKGRYYSLLKDWSYIFYRNSESSYTVTPEDFVRRTEVTILDEPDLDTFFKEFHVITGNKQYIKNNYSTYLEKLYSDFKIMSIIQRDYSKFCLHNMNEDGIKTDDEFVNKESKKILEDLGLRDRKEDIDIARLIVWSRINHQAYFENIEEAVGVENK